MVESGFRLQRRALEDGIPGFDPPENAKKRQGKKYYRDACLTLAQFTGIILSSVIAHNRSPMLHYDLSLKEIGDRVEPSPLALWRHGIVDRAGLLTRYDEQQVHLALLPRDTATVTEEGISVNRCFYTCQAAIAGGWMVQARRKRFKLVAIYDRRSVDVMYVQNPLKPGEVHACSLTAKSKKYQGLSVAEVEGLYQIERARKAAHEQAIAQKLYEMHRYSDEQVAAARKALRAIGSSPVRKARRADTKPARQAELREERAELTAGDLPANVPPASSSNVSRLSEKRRGVLANGANGAIGDQPNPNGPEPTAQASDPEAVAEAVRRMLDRMNGKN